MSPEILFENFELLADAPNGVRKLRELILQLAVQGKLVPQDPNDEPASVFLNKIKAEKERLIKEGKIKKSKSLPPIDGNGLPYELPKGWEWARLGEVYKFEYGKGLPQNSRNESGDFPVYGSNGIVGYHDEYLVNEKSLVVGRKGSIGAVNLVLEPFWPIDTTYYVTPPESLDLLYTNYLLKTLELGKLDKATAIPGLNRQDAYIIIVGLPPTPEQKRIVAKVDKLMALCDQLEARQNKRKEHRIRLNNAALDKLLATRDPRSSLSTGSASVAISTSFTITSKMWASSASPSSSSQSRASSSRKTQMMNQPLSCWKGSRLKRSD